MNSSPRRRFRPTPSPGPSRQRRSNRSTAGLMLLCGLLYGVVGFLVTALPSFPWLWPITLVALGLHIWDLTLPTADPPVKRRIPRLGAGILHSMGALLLTLTLAVALNYIGSDQLDDITLGGVTGQVVVLSLLALGVASLCRWLTARLGEGLLSRLPQRPTRLVLGTVGLLGLALGGAIGVWVF